MESSNKRKKPEPERRSITHRFEVGGHKGYLTIGFYDDDKPCEIFIKMAKQGSTVSGLLDALSIAVSLGLQYGVPMSNFVDKFSRQSFEPSGMTSNKSDDDLKFASSIVDYIFRWIESKNLSLTKTETNA